MESAATDLPDIASKDLPRDKRTGREIAYGVQQTFACWATDFIDPPVSKWFQTKFGSKSHDVTHRHVWGGEFLGDTSAFFVYVALKRFLYKPIDALIGGVKSAFDNRFTKMGEKSLALWRQHEHVGENDPRYKQKLEAYKHFQAENLVDSTLIATSATLTNVGFQKMLGNGQNLRVILASKIVGAIATMSVMLGLRSRFPTATRTLDEELDDRYFSHAVRIAKRAIGVKEEAPILSASEMKEEEIRKKKEAKAARRMPAAPVLEAGAAATVASMATLKIMDKEREIAELIPRGLGIGALASSAVLALHFLLPKFSKAFNDELRERYNPRRSAEAKATKEAVPAPLAATAPTLEAAPIAEGALGGDKRAAFMLNLRQAYVGRDVNDTAAFDRFREEQKRVCDAFIVALYPKGAFAEALADGHFHSMRRLDAVTDHTRMKYSSTVGIQSILINRRDDMLASRKLLDDDAFLAELKTQLAQPLPPGANTLPEEKAETLVESLVQTRGPQGREPAVHIYANARGQVAEHQALADAFDPKGRAAAVLNSELTARLPGFTKEAVTKITTDYMQARKSAAEKVVDALTPDGAVVGEAVRRSEAVRLRTRKALPQNFAERASIPAAPLSAAV